MKAFTERQRLIVKRLCQNSDFMEFADYFQLVMAETKSNLLTANDDNFKKLQGVGIFLDQLINDIESASERTDSK